MTNELEMIRTELTNNETKYASDNKMLEQALEEIKNLKSNLILVQNERNTLKKDLVATQQNLADLERTRRENDEIMRGLNEMEEKLKSVEHMKRSYETRITALKTRLAEANKILSQQAKGKSSSYFGIIDMTDEKPDEKPKTKKPTSHVAQTLSLFDLEDTPSTDNWLQPLPDD